MTDARLVPPLATVLCGACAAENVRAYTLGTVEKRPGGWVVWLTVDPTFGKRMRRAGHQVSDSRGIQTLVPPEFVTAALDVPDRLPAYCRRHGVGSVSTADVTSARGTMYLFFKADA